MQVEINYLGVVLAMVASMVIGAVWYDRHVFGEVWARLAGLKTDRKVPGDALAKLLVVQAVLSLATAYILAHFVWYVHAYNSGNWLGDAVQCALWAWLGFTALRLATHDMFEGRRKKLTLLNCVYELLTIGAMGVVIGLLHP
jgi:hypothetical protein